MAWGRGKSRGMVGGSTTTSQALDSGLACGLLLGAHAGYHLECDLCILDLLELNSTWVRQKADKGSSTWALQDFIEPHHTSDGLL